MDRKRKTGNAGNVAGMGGLIGRLPWPVLVVFCLTLGLAPFSPPHIWEKSVLLFKGDLVKPVDWFDFFFHGFPWALLALKSIISFQTGKRS